MNKLERKLLYSVSIFVNLYAVTRGFILLIGEFFWPRHAGACNKYENKVLIC